ncbi:MAG: F0F1 ATP synthase subunit delta [Clostridiales bacterium]|jgi:F0F1-type ATP synthase delta subunit|nr:F0F1 ATP synthase subunit delta [Clostridiales bacterium]
MKRSLLLVAPSFDERSISLVRDEFEALTGSAPDFDVIKDEKLVGGFIAIVEGKVYDASFSSRLSAIRRRMTE